MTRQNLILSIQNNALSANLEGGVFDFVLALPGQASSPHTHRAYFRWVDQYLVDVAGLTPTRGAQRIARMRRLPVVTLLSSLSAPQLRAWMGILSGRAHGKQGLNQARAAVGEDRVAVAELARPETEKAGGAAFPGPHERRAVKGLS